VRERAMESDGDRTGAKSARKSLAARESEGVAYRGSHEQGRGGGDGGGSVE
jgi:hypothetical protein